MMCDESKDVHYCDYGCGNIAQYQLKNGKWCCSENWNYCLSTRKKKSERLKEEYANGSRVKAMLNKPAWNKGKTYEEIFGIERANEIINKIKAKNKGNSLIGRCKIEENEQQRRKKISKKMKENGSGGYKKGSGRGKKGWYKGYWCDSSWELAYVIYNLEHDIKFTRNHEGFEYQYEDRVHKYYPDFILEDGSYVEIKGYMTKKNQAKISSFTKQLKTIDKEGIKLYLQYAIERYRRDYISKINV